MEDSTSSINLLTMKTYPSENNNLLEPSEYKLDISPADKMVDSENPIITKKKRRWRFVVAWSVIILAVLLLATFIVVFVKFSGDEGSKHDNITATTISPTPSYTVTPSSVMSTSSIILTPSSVSPSSSVSLTSSSSPTVESSSVTIHSTFTVEPSKSSVISTVVTTSTTTGSATTPTSTVSITTSKPLPACLIGEFQCSDGSCINKRYVCDGRPHCGSGEDEHLGCECTDDQFRCHSGQCIEKRFRCDKAAHCKDHSDEMNCPGCQGFQCDSGECLWTSSVICNRHVDCLDLSDEMRCSDRIGHTKCKNGMWIPKDKFCDGIDDCFDNSDETDCGDDCNIMAEMQCGNTSECIIHNWKCDGHDDCSDGWDESSSTCGKCGPDEFKCSDHVCIPNQQVCDGIKQCSSGTDEVDCLKLYKSEDFTSTLSGVVKVMSDSGQFMPVCSDVWTPNITKEICQFFGHSDEGAISTHDTVTSLGLPSPSSYMLVKDEGHKLAGTETVLSRFTSISSCAAEKIVSVTCQPSNCGERKVIPEVPFIVGGSMAPEGQWPWVVSLSLLGQGVCGGAILGPRWILTAAHCIVTSEANYTLTPHYFEITAGTISRTRSVNDTAQRRRVDKIFLHPNMTRLANWITDWDLALLHLESPLQYGNYLQPICMPSQNEEFASSSLCYLAGWGYINPQDVTVNYLREAKMRLWSDEDCAQNTHYENTPININSTLCAGYVSGIISGCKGDSGSPLMCKDNRDHWNVVGVMSYGSSGCDGQNSGRTNRMAKVSSASDWISSVIET